MEQVPIYRLIPKLVDSFGKLPFSEKFLYFSNFVCDQIYKKMLTFPLASAVHNIMLTYHMLLCKAFDTQEEQELLWMSSPVLHKLSNVSMITRRKLRS